MKPILSIIVAGALIISAGLAQQAAKPAVVPQPAPKPAPTKIAVVDIIRALSETAEGQKEFTAVQNWANKENEKLKQQESDYNALRNRYMQEQLKLGPEARVEMERQLQDSETRLRRRQEDLTQELAQRRQDILNRLGSKMQQVIQQYAQQNNYLAILIAQEGIFAYVAPAGDLTSQVVKLYDVRYPVVTSAPKNP